ncbi:MAG: hypothetical protein R6U04_02640 [Bacteroidales bacterium]
MKDLNRAQKVKMLYGNGSSTDLIKDRAIKINSIADLLTFKDDINAGKYNGLKTVDFIEQNGQIFTPEQYEKGGKEAGLRDVLRAANEFDVIILFSAAVYEVIQKEN